MNKKIYLESKFILITDAEVQPSENQLIVDSEKESEIVVNDSVKKFIQQTDKNNLILLSKNVNVLFGKIKLLFKFIEAAGGLIVKDNKYLFIHRLGCWDLPKGKIDKGENKEEAAIRECEEECGINRLKIIKELPSTYHIYPYKNTFALKVSYWFLMETDFDGKLIPQLEENIDKAEWMDKEQIQNTVLKKTYPSVSDVINLSNII